MSKVNFLRIFPIVTVIVIGALISPVRAYAMACEESLRPFDGHAFLTGQVVDYNRLRRRLRPQVLYAHTAPLGIEAALVMESYLYFEPSGDYFWPHRRADGKLSIYWGDAIGHGWDAARTALEILDAVWRGDFARALEAPGPAESTLVEIDRIFTFSPEHRGTSLAHLLIDPRRRTLEFAASFHFAPVFVRRGTGEIVELASGGLPIGSGLREYDKVFRTGTATLDYETGDTVVLFSDGVWESFGHVLGRPPQLPEKRFRPVLERISPRASAPAVLEGLRRESYYRFDDKSYLVLKLP